MMAAALYIHIPFCSSKCPYCSFVSFSGMTTTYGRYISALLHELAGISQRNDLPELQSVFVGGGTPTVLACDQLCSLLQRCQKLFRLRDGAEISVEANPGTLDPVYLRQLHQTGVNRISLGIQSFSDQELKILGRCHDRSVALEAISQAQKEGFANINLDLMYGLPGQSVGSWQKSLEIALAQRPQHLSCYQLTVEDGTVYAELRRAGRLQLPDEEAIEQMDSLTYSLCRGAGLRQYEISNFALPGSECRHNVNYWLNGDYYAAGAGAVSYLAGRRERRANNPLQYCRLMEEENAAVVAGECLDKEASFRESVVVGLRMVEGVSCQALSDRYGLELYSYYGDIIKKLLKASLVERSSTHLRLTARGRQVANAIMAELV